MDFRAANPIEALELARTLQRDGTHAFFRGQRRDWPLRPSLFRLTAASRELADQRFHRLYAWARATQGLEPIASEDCLLAVAQHYGIPTPFLDFTTDPGGGGVLCL